MINSDSRTDLGLTIMTTKMIFSENFVKTKVV
jgi:hypothetical protein